MADLAKRLGNLETLAAGIPELVAKIEDAATKEELNAVKSEVQKYQDYFDSIFAMVTSVELYEALSCMQQLVTMLPKDLVQRC